MSYTASSAHRDSPITVAEQSGAELSRIAQDMDNKLDQANRRSSKPTQPPRAKKVTEGFLVPADATATAPETASTEPVSAPVVKSKAEAKAERRAIQEAQRAKKAAALGKAGAKGKSIDANAKKAKGGANAPTNNNKQQQQSKARQGQIATGDPKQTKVTTKKSVSGLELFSHLPVNKVLNSTTLNVDVNGAIHPSVVRVGLWYNRNVITGSNSRCIYMLEAFKALYQTFEPAADKELRREFDSVLKPHITYLSECRPLSVSMRNAIKFLKLTISNLDTDLTLEEVRERVNDAIDNFINERIKLSCTQICAYGQDRVENGDVLAIHGASGVVEQIFIQAHEEGKDFRVIVIDSRPRLEGKRLLKRLTKHGIDCTYVLITGASYALKEATKVFLGAHTFFANGHMMARTGTAVVAMNAKAQGIPVIVCCETYKFWAARVQTDCFVYNELDIPTDLIPPPNRTDDAAPSPLDKDDLPTNIGMINIVYDVTPPEFIDMIITEIGMIPCSSIPVILREYDVYKKEGAAVV